MSRTLKDYRPQHDDKCNRVTCGACGYGIECIHDNTCTCGLSALLSVPHQEETRMQIQDHGAGLIHQVASPIAETEPRPNSKCPESEHADGKSHTWRRFTPTQFQCWWCGELRDDKEPR